MSKEITTPFNHESESIKEATGVCPMQAVKKANAIIDEQNENDVRKTSMLVQAYENGMTKRELALLVSIHNL